MTGKLILRHEIFRCLPKLLAVGSVTTMLVIQVMMFKIARSEGQWEPLGGGLFLLQAVITASCAAVFFVPSAGNRSRPWEQGLPLPAPQLWRAYLTALTIGSLLLLAGVGTILSLVQMLMVKMTKGELLVFASLGELLVRPAAVLILGTACIAAWQPQLARLHDHPSWTRYRWVLGAGLLVLLYGLARLPIAFSLAPVGLAALLVLWAGRRVPVVLTSSLDRGTPAASTADLAAGLAGVEPSRRVLNYLILRQLFKWPASLPLILPITLLFGVLMSGHNFLGESDTDLRLFNFFMVVYILFSMTGHLVEKLHLVDHLPISRRTILLWLVVPQMLALMIGYGGGRWLVAREPAGELILLDESADSYGVKLPPEFWQVKLTSGEELIAAPWDETYPAMSVPLFKGLPGQFWKPFTTPPEASLDFVAWQLSRAVQAVYGADLAPEYIADTYLVIGPEGRVVAREQGLTLAGDHPAWRTPYGGPVFPVLLGGEIVLWLLTLALFFRLCKPGMTIKKVRVRFWIIMAALLGLHIVMFIGFILEFSSDWIVSGAFLSTMRSLVSTGLTGGFVMGFVMVMMIFGAWRLAETSFARVEAPRS